MIDILILIKKTNLLLKINLSFYNSFDLYVFDIFVQFDYSKAFDHV